MSPSTMVATQKWVGEGEGSGAWWAQSHGNGTVPRIEIGINSVRKATFREFIDE